MRILIALDPTDAAEAIIDASRRLFGDEVDRLVLSVVDAGAPVVFDPLGVAPSLTSELSERSATGEHRASEVADGVAERLGGRPETRTGDPAASICEVAEEWDVDVIVVGSHHRGLLRRLLDPPVTPAVLRQASRPVLVVPRPEEATTAT